MLGPDPYDLPKANPYDLPKADPSSPPTEPNPSTASGGQLAWLGFGLGLGFICFALPAWFLVWLASTVFGTIGIADLLEQTRGLAPTTYGGAFWLATAFTSLMVLVELFAIFRPKEERPGCLVAILTRPSLALFFLAIPTWLLVKIDMGGTDVPDILTTFLLLVSLGYIFVILPIALLALCCRVARSLWRFGKGSGFRSGVFGTLGIALATLLPLVCATHDPTEADDDEGEEIAAQLEHGAAVIDREGLPDGSLILLKEITEAPGHSLPRLKPKDLFDECIEDLFRDGDGRSHLRKTISDLASGGTDLDLAEQIAQETAIEVCLGHSKSPFDNVESRFLWLARQRKKNHWRHTSVVQRCTIAVEQHFYDPLPSSPTDHVQQLQLNRALCSMEKLDREVLRDWAIGFNATEIAAKRGISASTVRQRKKRALAKLRRMLAN